MAPAEAPRWPAVRVQAASSPSFAESSKAAPMLAQNPPFVLLRSDANSFVMAMASSTCVPELALVPGQAPPQVRQLVQALPPPAAFPPVSY